MEKEEIKEIIIVSKNGNQLRLPIKDFEIPEINYAGDSPFPPNSTFVEPNQGLDKLNRGHQSEQ